MVLHLHSNIYYHIIWFCNPCADFSTYVITLRFVARADLLASRKLGFHLTYSFLWNCVLCLSYNFLWNYVAYVKYVCRGDHVCYLFLVLTVKWTLDPGRQRAYFLDGTQGEATRSDIVTLQKSTENCIEAQVYVRVSHYIVKF